MALPADAADNGRVWRRFGMGWQFRPPAAPVVMTFTNVADKRGELRTELHVQNARGGHMLRRHLNLMGSKSVDDLAKDLARADGGAGFPWGSILESATESLIGAVRVGPPLETYGGRMDRPPAVRWLCEGLVMADVPNVWIAAGSTGKSTFAAALAVHHAIGEPFLGRATTKGVPLYLDWESDADDFREKVWLVSRWLGLSEVPTVHRLRMRGAASTHAVAIANRIDELGATLTIWDGIQAAGGVPSQYATYESIALDIEALLGLLPLTTHLLLDHVTGDDLKTGAIPLKGRGGSRKVEWTRNQWTITLDREQQASQCHLVGWTHTKINRGAALPAFGVEILHRPDEMGFRVVDESEVEPLRERMSERRQLIAVVQRFRAITPRDAAREWLGREDDKSIARVRHILRTDHGKSFREYSDGTFSVRESWRNDVPDASAEPTPIRSDIGSAEPLQSEFDEGGFNEEDLPF